MFTQRENVEEQLLLVFPALFPPHRRRLVFMEVHRSRIFMTKLFGFLNLESIRVVKLKLRN